MENTSQIEILSQELDSLKKTLFDFIQSQKQPDERPIFIDEVSKITNLKKGTIYILVNRGEIPVIKVPGAKKLMFSRSAIIQWLLTGRKTSKN